MLSQMSSFIGVRHIDTVLTVNQRHTRAIRTASANSSEVAIEKIGAPNLKALFDDLGSELVHAVVCGPQ